VGEPSYVTDNPDRVFADRRGVTWHLHVGRPNPALDVALALEAGGTVRLAPPGFYFVAHSGERATYLCPAAWLPTPRQVAAYTWGELLNLLEHAHHSPAPDPTNLG
jgi:hypothetical protein